MNVNAILFLIFYAMVGGQFITSWDEGYNLKWSFSQRIFFFLIIGPVGWAIILFWLIFKVFGPPIKGFWNFLGRQTKSN